MNRLKIIVSDPSVLRDLAKVHLIEAALALPFDFIMPETIALGGFLDLGAYTSADMLRLGVQTAALDSADTGKVIAHYRKQRCALTLNDCFAWHIAENSGGILMTSDAVLRRAATESGLEVRDTLWVTALIREHQTCSEKALIKALDLLDQDPFVLLPRSVLRALKAKVSERA